MKNEILLQIKTKSDIGQAQVDRHGCNIDLCSLSLLRAFEEANIITYCFSYLYLKDSRVCLILWSTVSQNWVIRKILNVKSSIDRFKYTIGRLKSLKELSLQSIQLAKAKRLFVFSNLIQNMMVDTTLSELCHFDACNRWNNTRLLSHHFSHIRILLARNPGYKRALNLTLSCSGAFGFP